MKLGNIFGVHGDEYMRRVQYRAGHYGFIVFFIGTMSLSGVALWMDNVAAALMLQGVWFVAGFTYLGVLYAKGYFTAVQERSMGREARQLTTRLVIRQALWYGLAMTFVSYAFDALDEPSVPELTPAVALRYVARGFGSAVFFGFFMWFLFVYRKRQQE